MLTDLLRTITRKREDEPPVEMLDVETLRRRIGEPLAPKAPEPADADYVRADGRPEEQGRSWRRTAGPTR